MSKKNSRFDDLIDAARSRQQRDEFLVLMIR